MFANFVLSLCVSRRLIDRAYCPFHAVLHCGNLSADVQVFPRPEPVVVDEEVEPLARTVNPGTFAAMKLNTGYIQVDFRIPWLSSKFSNLMVSALCDCAIYCNYHNKITLVRRLS